jgi:CHAT domain-containing protein
VPTRRPNLAFVLALGLLLVAQIAIAADTLDPRLETAIGLYRKEGAEQALPVFMGLVREFSQNARSHDLAAATHYVGECHWRLGNFPEARTYLDRALAMERNAGDRLAEGKTLNVMGLLEWDQGNYERAIARFKASGAVARSIGDKKLEGSSLNNLSLVYDELGDYDTSLKQYQQVLELYRGADFPRGVGDTLGNIGGVHLLLGNFRAALGYYQQALAISEQLDSKPSMSQDHGNIGLCLLGLGDVDQALLHFDRAIEFAKQTGMRQDQAYWTREKGNGQIRRGQYTHGMASHRASLSIYQELGAKAELLETLHDTGQLYLLLGDTESAEKNFKRALEMARSINLDRGVTVNLVSLGNLELRRKRFDAAGAYFEQARQRSAEAGQQHLLARSLLRLAAVNREQQRLVPAAEQTRQALTIARQIGARGVEAEALYSQAEIDRLQGRVAQALSGYTSAQAALLRIGDPDLQWQILFGRARAAEAKGDVEGAIASLQSAVDLIEGVRSRLLESRFRAGYVEDKFEVYRELMRLQLQQGRTSDAFTTAERQRARNFVEQLGGRSELPLSPDERRQETQLRERIRLLQDALADEDEQGNPSYPQRAMDKFSQGLRVAEREYQAFLDDHAHARPAVGGGGAALTAAGVQRHLDDDEALLEYVVGRDSLVVFVLTSKGIAVRTSPVPEADLEARISLLRDLVRHPGDDRWLKPAARLSALLIAPLETGGLLRGVRRLYIVPHGTLNYLSFALLPSGAQDRRNLLIDRYTVAYLPAAAVLLQGSDASAAPRSLLAMAPDRARLRYASEEARSVDALYRPNSRLLIGSSATESRFKQHAGDYRVLHLATHGYFDKANPLLSGIELESDGANDGLLQVHEVLGLRLRSDLVTLSACDTALGSGYFAEMPTGDDFVGMTRAFLSAGSRSVLAALWPVDDRASVTLMRRFYGRLNTTTGDRTAAGALAHVQRELRRSGDLGHPYYWAEYIVVGAMDRNTEDKKDPAGRKS